MTLEVGGAGTLGLAFETTFGTFVAPTKWIPIRSESLNKVEDKIYRMNIRGLADRSGAVQGYYHIEGDITFEVTSDALVYFLYAARTTPVKAAGVSPFTYTFTPVHVAKPTTATGTGTRKSLSALVTRAANPMGYTGLSVGQLAFSLDAGMLVCTASMYGIDEASQSSATPTWATSVPFGPGKVSLEVPTATARADADTFTLTINDNIGTANRLDGNRKPSYSTWGEREVTASMDYDFDTRATYETFTAQTQQEVTFAAVNNAASDSVTIVLSATIADSHTVNLGGLGDLVRGSIAYHGIHGSTAVYTITVKTTEDIT